MDKFLWPSLNIWTLIQMSLTCFKILFNYKLQSRRLNEEIGCGTWSSMGLVIKCDNQFCKLGVDATHSRKYESLKQFQFQIQIQILPPFSKGSKRFQNFPEVNKQTLSKLSSRHLMIALRVKQFVMSSFWKEK